MRIAPISIRPFLTILAVGAAFLSVPESKAGESQLEGSTKRMEQLDSLLNPEKKEKKAAESSKAKSHSSAEKQTSGLNGSSLETDTNLNPNARGLTPSEEWRRKFQKSAR